MLLSIVGTMVDPHLSVATIYTQSTELLHNLHNSIKDSLSILMSISNTKNNSGSLGVGKAWNGKKKQSRDKESMDGLTTDR